jgi:ABC-type multidrug transport system ATPase subunit
MIPENGKIVFDGVSKFYGEILGVNRVSFALEPGITALVGPNGSGKTTLMNLMTGLIHPTHGTVLVRGLSPGQPEEFFRQVGYCTIRFLSSRCERLRFHLLAVAPGRILSGTGGGTGA